MAGNTFASVGQRTGAIAASAPRPRALPVDKTSMKIEKTPRLRRSGVIGPKSFGIINSAKL